MLTALAVLLPALGACPVDGVPPKPVAANTLTEAERSAGWRLLFDGRTTAGWRNYGKPVISDGWVVKDSALTRTGAGGDIIKDSDAIYWNAPEMQVLDDAKHPDGKSPLTSSGAAYDLYPAPTGHVHPAGDWNTARLVVNGNHVEHWLNGFKMVEFELGSRDWGSKVAGSKFKPHPRFGKNAQGHIGLQDHGNVVAFRNIKIRVLP
ncbi:MAG: DUF1080 domain-containing protein [Gemmatimonadetes bacterium]|nr:MAG: DUF1080 domain-containing protein [Gemmatimonadota bacterium]